jgi:hypothetical protein
MHYLGTEASAGSLNVSSWRVELSAGDLNRSKEMKSFWKVGTLYAALTMATLGPVGFTRADNNDRGKIADVITSILFLPKEGSAVTLLVQGKAQPVTVTISDNTILSRACTHCGMMQKFKASEAAKHCKMCRCDAPNVECVAWKSLKANTWQQLLSALPQGIALRAIYNETDKPASGLKSLLIDHHTVLLPVEGLSGQTADQLQALVKPVGGANAQLVADGKQLQFTLKDNWESDKAAKLVKELAKASAKLAYPAPDETQK